MSNEDINKANVTRFLMDYSLCENDWQTIFAPKPEIMFGLPTDLQHTDNTELKQVMQQTIMLQNGMVASQMAKSGVRGNMNYGVSLTDLRKIADSVGINHTLARDLCQLKIREAKILASMIFDIEKMDNGDLQLVADSITNIDLAENFARNTIGKIDNIGFIEQLANGTVWQAVTSIHAIGWASIRKEKFASAYEKWFLDNVADIAGRHINETRQPILTTLDSIAHSSEEKRKSVEQMAEKFKTSASEFEHSIGDQYFWLYTDNYSK